MDEGQVRHRDEVQPAVEDAEDVVALEVQAVGVAPDLLVRRRMAEAQVAVTLVQREQAVAALDQARDSLLTRARST